jgi:transcriptional adapter 2-alpha
VDNLSFPLFTLDWGADEDVLLLEAIEMYGLGNWSEVSEHVGTKTKAQCHAHYFDVYVNSPTAPLPDMSKILGKSHARVDDSVGKEEEAKKSKKEDSEEDENEERRKVGGGEKESTLASFARPGDERHFGNVPELTGYNVKRDEFDPEYDIDAELPLAEMEFRDTDTDLDKQLKLRMLEVYNKRLAERRARKQFIIDRGLLNVKKQQALERKRTPQEKEIHASVRVFARFLEPNEYEIMLEGLAAESRIRNRIAELKEYRRAGVHTLLEGEIYDQEKRRRAAETARLRALEYPASGKQGASSRANKYLSRDGYVTAGAAGDAAPKEVQKLAHSAGGALASGSNVDFSRRKKTPLPLDLADLPGVDLLSKREKDLCVNSRLLPVHYLAIKERLMRLSADGTILKRSEVRHAFQIEPVKAIRIFELLLANGWIKSGDSCGGKKEDAA